MAKAKGPIKLERMKIVLVPVEDLHPNAYNPNRQKKREFDLLCASIRKNGFTQPIIARSDGTIIDGEHRWRAGQEIGLTKVPVVYMPDDVSDEQARISTLRMNRARGTNDQELLGGLLRDMEQLGALGEMGKVLGMDDSDMQALMGGTSAADMLGGEGFSQAWEPDLLNDPASGAYSAEEPQTFGEDRTTTVASVTARGARLLNERDAAVEDIADPLQRQEAKAELLLDESRVAPIRVTAVFRASDAVFVQGVLGVQAADTLLELCKAKYLELVEAGNVVPNPVVALLWEGPVKLWGKVYDSVSDAFKDTSKGATA